MLPSASADVRGHPRHVWTEDGRWGNYEEKTRKIGLNGRNQGAMGEILLPSASVSFRQLPQLADCGGFVVAAFFYPAGGVGIFSGGR